MSSRHTVIAELRADGLLPATGASARLDGYEIRSATVAADIPCITTVQGAAAAVMGIEALIRGEMAVRPHPRPPRRAARVSP